MVRFPVTLLDDSDNHINLAGAPFVVQTTAGTLVAGFHTDEDTSAKTWFVVWVS
jgi:hypothetical protein